MLYAESGRYPIDIIIKTRMISFWNRLNSENSNKLSFKVYQYMCNMPNFNSKWINKIKSILNETGMSDVWLNQHMMQGQSPYYLKLECKQRFIDQNMQNWHSSLQNASKGRNYSIFKSQIKLEDYILKLSKPNYISLLKFRTANHFFPVETGRWNDVDYSDKKCSLCNLDDIGDEMHYLLICPHFHVERKRYVKEYFYLRPNILKYQQLMSVSSQNELINLCKFVKCLLNTINNER